MCKMRKFFTQMARFKGAAAFLAAAALVFALAACPNTTNTPEEPEQQYTITFDSREGTAVDPIKADAGTEVQRPANPTRTGGYTFRGWYDAASGGTRYTWPHILDADVTMYAQWNDPEEPPDPPDPPALTGTVTITGTAQVDQVLTANTGNLGGSGTISYVWERSDSANGTFAAIVDAVAATYMPAAGDLDAYVRVTVSREGYSGTRSSVATRIAASPLPPLPSLTGTVTVDGTGQVGQVLTANTDNLEGSGTISYAWQRSNFANGPFAPISGADAVTYTPATEDLNTYVRVTVTREGHRGTVNSAATGPVSLTPLPSLTGAVAVTGTAQVGEVLTANTDELGGSGTISYGWQRGNSAGGAFTAISGATAATYTLAAADLDKYLRVTASREGHSGTINSDATGPIILPPLTGSVTAGGSPWTGQALTANTDELGGSGTISYAWQRGDSVDGTFAAIFGATASTYTLAAADLNAYLRVTVSRANNSETVTSAAAGPVIRPPLAGAVTVEGTPLETLVLTANTAGLEGSGVISYAWERSDSAGGTFAAISGATASTYTLAAADLEQYLRVTVSRANNSGTVSSAATAQIHPRPSLEGTVAIPGTAAAAQVGMVLTVDVEELEGSGAISYEWQQGDSADGTFVAISGATAATYTLAAADLGKYVRVRVSRVNNSGEVFSNATAAISLQLPRITIGFNYGVISISGNNGTNIIYKYSDDPGAIELTATDYTDVKWYIDGAATPVGTGDSITLAASDAAYTVAAHTITFTGQKDGRLYAQVIPFTVKN
jgi:uncharacterized repeat protein (TIGR02543 family)